MKNFSQPGNVLEVTAPKALTSGQGFVVGSLFLVATKDALNGALINGLREGVVTLPKLSADDMQPGEKVNWNSSNDELQEATSTLDGVATVVDAAGNGVLSVVVVLTPI